MQNTCLKELCTRKIIVKVVNRGQRQLIAVGFEEDDDFLAVYAGSPVGFKSTADPIATHK
jgi:hypothetical protein